MERDNRTLYLRPDLAVIRMASGVQLRSGDEEIRTIDSDEPEVIERLLDLLTGGASAEELGRLVESDQRQLVSDLLQQLGSAGMLLETPIESNDTISRYLAHFPFPGNEPSTISSGPIAVTGHAAGVRLLAQALREHGIHVVHLEIVPGPGLELDSVVAAMVFIWEQPDLHRALAANAAACRLRIPCLFVDMSHGQHATLGPFFVPDEGACYQCFRHRWRENTSAREEFDSAESHMLNSGQALPAYGTLPAFRYQVAGIASAELVALLTRHRPLRTLNRVATVDLERMKLQTEPCWKIPWCATCGTEDTRG